MMLAALFYCPYADAHPPTTDAASKKAEVPYAVYSHTFHHAEPKPIELTYTHQEHRQSMSKHKQ
ncbi:MAG: hypothetical protein ACXWQ5_19205, partial [Ktedonobacterales bacterium]